MKLSFLVISISVQPGKATHYTNLIWVDKNQENNKHFCKLRNLVQSAESIYFQDKIEENRSERIKLWQQFKNAGYKYKQNNCGNSVSIMMVKL